MEDVIDPTSKRYKLRIIIRLLKADYKEEPIINICRATEIATEEEVRDIFKLLKNEGVVYYDAQGQINYNNI